MGGLTMALYKEEGRVMYSKKDYTEEDIQWAKSDLNNRLDMMPADGLKSPIYAIIRKVSSSGLTRYISFYINQFNPETGNVFLHDITFMMARILNESVYREGGGSIQVRGTGMDMAFHTVDNFFMALNSIEGIQQPDQRWTQSYESKII